MGQEKLGKPTNLLLLLLLFPPLRFVFVGAAPVGQALIEKFKEKAPECVFREGEKEKT